MENNDVWEVGQEVWCVVNGKGTVETVSALNVYVSFRNEHCTSAVPYWKNGKRNLYDANRTLFFSEPTVSGLTSPPFKRVTKDGQTLLAVWKDKITAEGGANGSDGFLFVVKGEDENIVYGVDGRRVSKDHWAIFNIDNIQKVV